MYILRSEKFVTVLGGCIVEMEKMIQDTKSKYW